MSQENVEIVRRLYSYWRDNAFTDLEPGYWALLDPNVVWDASRRAFDPDVFQGHAGVREFGSRLREVWASGRIEPLAFIPAGDRVVVPVRLTFIGRTEGQEVTAKAAHVWTIAGGKVVSHCVYQTKAEALEAVGLSE